MSSRSEPDRWTVVGGGVEPNESGMITSVREAREEVRRERERDREREKERERERGGLVGVRTLCRNFFRNYRHSKQWGIIRMLKSTGIIGIGTSRFVLYREVFFIRSVLYRRFHCIGILSNGELCENNQLKYF